MSSVLIVSSFSMMRVSTLIPLGWFFALSVVALPEFSAYRTETVDVEALPDLSTHKNDKFSEHRLLRRIDPNARFKPYCQGESQRTAEKWNNMSMGTLLQSQSDLFFDEGPHYNGPYGKFGDRTFIQALVDQLKGFADYGECRVGHCEAKTISKELCEEGENSMWLFFLDAIGNYVRWIGDLSSSAKAGLDAAADLTGPIATDFSQDAETSVNWKNGVNIMMGGIVGGVGSILGPVTGIMTSAGLGLLGSAIGIGVGIINSGIQNAEAVKVQNKLKRAALLYQVVRDWQGAFNATLIHWGEELVNNPPNPQNDPWKDDWYSIKDWSLPAVVKSGEFASRRKQFPENEFTGNMTKHFSAGAISAVWREEKAFIVKLKGTIAGKDETDKTVAEKTGCEFKDELEDRWHVKVYCKDNTAYFLIRDYSHPSTYITVWPPPGVKKLESYGWTEEYAVLSSITAFEKFGLSDKYDDVTMDDYNLKEAHDPLFRIPICDLDSVKDDWRSSKWAVTGVMRTYFTQPWIRLFYAIDACNQIEGFPYKLETFY